jgi:hypothetical protein
MEYHIRSPRVAGRVPSCVAFLASRVQFVAWLTPSLPCNKWLSVSRMPGHDSTSGFLAQTVVEALLLLSPK